jgi:hypothetical protein
MSDRWLLDVLVKFMGMIVLVPRAMLVLNSGQYLQQSKQTNKKTKKRTKRDHDIRT